MVDIDYASFTNITMDYLLSQYGNQVGIRQVGPSGIYLYTPNVDSPESEINKAKAARILYSAQQDSIRRHNEQMEAAFPPEQLVNIGTVVEIIRNCLE